MRRILVWGGSGAVVLVCLALLLIFVGQPFLISLIEKQMFVTRSAARHTPADYGAAYTRLECPSADRRLEARLVDAGRDTPAALIFHGNSETVPDWAKVQAYLAGHGLSTMVFDYSGFGRSSGQPTVAHLNADAGAAYACFVQHIGPSRPRFIIAHSLGSAVLLNNVAGFTPRPTAVVVHGAFSSVKDLLRFLGAPSYWVMLTPDIWNSARAARGLSGLPLLVVAGADDSNVPPDMGRRIAIAAPQGVFKQVWASGHEDILMQQNSYVWGPVLDFLNQRLRAGAWRGPMLTPAETFHP